MGFIQALFENLQSSKTIKIMFRRETKGGEKVNLRDRPYLEVEVVEVKKGKAKYIPKRCVGCRIVKTCVGIEKEREKEKQSNGNWVNGENLSKIKFPCACSYDGYEGMRYGMLTRGFVNGAAEYLLHTVRNGQCFLNSVESRCNSLKELITKRNIHIEKAKIVIFKETK